MFDLPEGVCLDVDADIVFLVDIVVDWVFGGWLVYLLVLFLPVSLSSVVSIGWRVDVVLVFLLDLLIATYNRTECIK